LYLFIGYNEGIEYKVVIKNKIQKKLYKLPRSVQVKLRDLLLDLRENGPLQPKWPNYSKLGKATYHCHLNRLYVACWEYEKNQLIIEVYYTGRRENAPY
jgi:mRNA-degrading endonuclease RelE of RelBE toxin-antitoxin system